MIKKTILILISTLPIYIYASEPLPKDGISGNFDLGLSFTKNSETTFQFNNLFLIKYQIRKSSFMLASNIAFINKSGEEKILNKGVQDFKYALNSRNLDLNFTINHMYDISRSIKNRYSSGLGVSYNHINEEDKKIGIGLSALREKENLLSGETKLQNRLSGDFDFMIKTGQNIIISSKSKYQPNIEEAGDFRWNTNLSLRISINSHFLLIINNTFNYDSMPEEGISRSDYQLINSISYTF